ncbi:MAG: 16S rRNA (guanine(966)-N(2))-methyltransferase RsmD [Elusimicrobia bacterium RIFOXYB2_FULL_48_7]|nr:MAG: 16S rRNA (guanine(966)-N(2))-methyltransferase RsmD [Elusimicrobia bacterium RIFOXYB2_FULL_48_7]
MRIIGGQMSGQLLNKIPEQLDLRPILAQIKKSVFDIIKLKVMDANFLDLFAGTGSVGIEAVSRGAKHAVFIESTSGGVKMIESNLDKLKIKELGNVYQRDVLYDLGWLSNAYKDNYFDIIFLGPPYKALLVNKTLENIAKAALLREDGMIIAQHHKTEDVDGSLFEIYRREKYGDTIVTFLKNKKQQ